MTFLQTTLLIFMAILLIAGNTMCLEFIFHTNINKRLRRLLAIPPFMMITVLAFGFWMVISEFYSWVYKTIKSFITE